MPRTHIAAIVALILSLTGTASADPSDSARRDTEPAQRAPRRFDYSRYSDGPRRVPAPRGASLERARHLGLGTRETASRLLHHPTPDAWTRAADWREGEVDRLLWPVDEGRYVRGYGYVRVTRPDLIHKGVDIAAPEGSVIRAAADGIVAYSDNGIRGYGNCILIVHPNGWVTLYGHMSRATVQPGWRVQRGERIGLVGQTGIAHGPHVHFELRRDGRAVDPVALFDGGPAFVRRVATRAAAAGRVPPPRALSAEDRRTPPPLAPWRDEDAPEAPAEVVGSEDESGDDDAAPGELGGLPLGDARLLRRLSRFAPTDAMRAAAGGRLFRNLLWPMRGGRSAGTGRTLAIVAEGGSAVRASADGLVVYAGRVGRRGRTVALLHRMGWVTLYTHLDDVHVEVGQRVERGEWIGETDRLELELYVEGRRTDPTPLLVQVPADAR